MYKWRIYKLEIIEEKQELQEEVTRNAAKFSELIKRVSTVDTEMERDRAGAKTIVVLKQLVKNVIGKKLIVCNRAVVKWWDDEVKEAIRVRREAHARCIYI